jgi:hypothetical protein
MPLNLLLFTYTQLYDSRNSIVNGFFYDLLVFVVFFSGSGHILPPKSRILAAGLGYTGLRQDSSQYRNACRLCSRCAAPELPHILLVPARLNHAVQMMSITQEQPPFL